MIEPIKITPFSLAQRFIGLREVSGDKNHPLIQWWLSLCFDGNISLPDLTPWCSAFVNGIAWELRLPRSKSAAAKSWLEVGVPTGLAVAEVGFDVCIFDRPPNPASGHVGFYAGYSDSQKQVLVLGGNQSDSVSISNYPVSRLLGIRRITP